MSKGHDGGSAFPYVATNEVCQDAQGNRYTADVPYPGMSLRDWFAAKAMVSAIEYARDLVPKGTTQTVGEWRMRVERHASEWAYRWADAMLEARNV